MSRFCPTATLLILAGTLPAAPRPKEEPPATLKGDWQLVGYTTDGDVVPDDLVRKVTARFGDGTVSIRPNLVSSTNDKTGAPTFELRDEAVDARFELGAEDKVRTFDLIVGAGKEARRLKGIYRLEGDELRICFAIEGDRPTAFESPKGTPTRLLHLRRARR